jgi:magnesium-transporting ATPase (P-type)
MDTFAALAFGGEPPLEVYMNEKPIQREENIINSYMWSSIIANGLYIAILSMLFLTSDSIKVPHHTTPNHITLHHSFLTPNTFVGLLIVFFCGVCLFM